LRGELGGPAVRRWPRAELHVHPRTLRRTFHASTWSVSVHQHWRDVRAQGSRAAPQETSLKIEAIALLVGCRHRSTFYQMVTATTGKTPTEIRPGTEVVAPERRSRQPTAAASPSVETRHDGVACRRRSLFNCLPRRPDHFCAEVHNLSCGCGFVRCSFRR
jgi:AraC-like DNA-binding protein